MRSWPTLRIIGTMSITGQRSDQKAPFLKWDKSMHSHPKPCQQERSKASSASYRALRLRIEEHLARLIDPWNYKSSTKDTRESKATTLLVTKSLASSHPTASSPSKVLNSKWQPDLVNWRLRILCTQHHRNWQLANLSHNRNCSRMKALANLKSALTTSTSAWKICGVSESP